MSTLSSFSIDPTKASNNYTVQFNAPRRALKSMREELEIALEHKANSTTKPLCILFSGGVDSQSLMIAARDRGIPFKAIHLAPRFKGELIAKQCIFQVKEFARRQNFKVEIHEIDITLGQYPFIPTMNLLRYQTPYLATHSLIGPGANNFHHNHNNINYYDARSYIHNEAPSWVLEDYGYDLNLAFYHYTPELYFSFLFHPLSKVNYLFLKDNPHLPPESSRLLKFNILYAEFGDELIYYQKRSGMEDYPKEIKRYDDAIWEATKVDTWESCWIVFKEAELRALYARELDHVIKRSTVNPLILRYIKPPKSLFRI